MTPEQREANNARHRQISPSKAHDMGYIVWIATYRGRKARIVSGKPVPGWIHEYGDQVKWKCVEGREYLNQLVAN